MLSPLKIITYSFPFCGIDLGAQGWIILLEYQVTYFLIVLYALFPFRKNYKSKNTEDAITKEPWV